MMSNIVHVLEAKDNARVHVGNVIYQSTEPSLAERKRAVLKSLQTSPYRDGKNRNPDRVPGTCEWFVTHESFRQWRESESSSLLWVSADPGCGKSVLAKHLLDSVIPSSESRTTCYFFFKDDFADQRSATSALCCILHQLFRQKDTLLTERLVERFELDGRNLTGSFNELWEVLATASQDENAGEIVCLLDALDECEDQGQSKITEALCKLYRAKNNFKLKFLVTSRPYTQIRRGFQPLDIPGLPVVHLSGESEAEIEKISREIDIFIQARTRSIQTILKLSSDEEQLLLQELLRIPHRTYLWVHLTLDLVQNDIDIDDGRSGIHRAVSRLPRSVDEAYEKILDKSRNVEKAKKLLRIVVTAARPLTLAEMAFAMTLQKNHKSYQDVKLQSEERFREHVRDLCGLFVSVIDSKIYLLHQTARDFLVPGQANHQDDSDDDSDDDPEDVPQTGPKSAPPTDPPKGPQDDPEHDSGNRLKWKYSLDPRESHRILCQLCIWHLLFAEFETHPLAPVKVIGPLIQYLNEHIFLDYSAKNWAAHFRLSDFQDEDDMSLLRICDADSKRCQTWFQIYWGSRRPGEIGFPEDFTTLMVASYSGIGRVVKLLLEKGEVDIDSRDHEYFRDSLSWASERGFADVVSLLIRGHKTRFKHIRSSSRKSASVNETDFWGRTPISYASWNGHRAVVKLLLKAGAHATVRDEFGGSPMSYALANGDKKMCRLLEKKGSQTGHAALVDLYVKMVGGIVGEERLRTARLLPKRWDTSTYQDSSDLYMSEHRQQLFVSAARWDNSEMAMRLLTMGADVNGYGNSGDTALVAAIEERSRTMVKLLVEKGADIETRDSLGRTPLFRVMPQDISFPPDMRVAIAKFLLGKGADITAKDDRGWTLLSWAAWYGDEAIARLLLEKGVDIEERDDDGYTPLLRASNTQYQTVFENLVSTFYARSDRTPLFPNAISCNEAVIQLFIEKGADIEARDNEDKTPLFMAAETSKEATVRLLLDRGANVDARDKIGATPLWIAASLGDGDLFPAASSSWRIRPRSDKRRLLPAARRRNEAVVELLVEHGADIEARDSVGNRTPLWLAALSGKEAIVKFLLDKGAKMERCGENMETPLEAASRGGHSSVVKLLKRRCREVSQ